MAVTVKDLLNLDVMKDFKVVAGERGLEKTVAETEILDFEFVQEGKTYREKSFEGNSIVLSSLLFAKNQPHLIAESIKMLIKFNVHCLAYKPVIYKKLPKEALELADKMNFPILEFGNDEFFEDVIFAVKEINQTDSNIGLAEPLIEKMINGELAQEEITRARYMINPLLRIYVMGVCIREKKASSGKTLQTIKKAKPLEGLLGKTFVGKYRDLYMVVLSLDEADPEKFKELYGEVIKAYNIDCEEMFVGFSEIRQIENYFDKILREAFWAEKIGEIEKRNVTYFQNLGIYKLIVEQIRLKSTADYMKGYLGPLFLGEDKDSELFKTAITYVLSKGDVLKTAEKMYCHKNTIRYRIGKLQERLDAQTTEKEFYENLAVAVKIYLLSDC